MSREKFGERNEHEEVRSELIALLRVPSGNSCLELTALVQKQVPFMRLASFNMQDAIIEPLLWRCGDINRLAVDFPASKRVRQMDRNTKPLDEGEPMFPREEEFAERSVRPDVRWILKPEQERPNHRFVEEPRDLVIWQLPQKLRQFLDCSLDRFLDTRRIGGRIRHRVALLRL